MIYFLSDEIIPVVNLKTLSEKIMSFEDVLILQARFRISPDKTILDTRKTFVNYRFH